MKTILTLLFIISFSFAFGQSKKEATLDIKTSAVCEMCKTTIEKEMVFEKGVKESNLNVETKVLHVVYNPKKTSPETIRKRLLKIGYDADTLKATREAVLQLDPCCRPGAHDDDNH